MGTSEGRLSLRDRVVEDVRQRIIDGRFPPGQPLVEARLADEFSVSRVPVREALQRLAEQGFVELRPGHSARVAQRSARDIVEMFEVRAVIEGLVCSLAATRRTDDDLASLKEIVRRGLDAANVQDWKTFAAQNRAFHDLLAAISRNSHLVETVEGYANRLAWTSLASAEQRGAGAFEEHAAIVDAIAGQDADLARQLAEEHVGATKDAFVHAFLDGSITL